jgi:hypothetical protein
MRSKFHQKLDLWDIRDNDPEFESGNGIPQPFPSHEKPIGGQISTRGG